MKGIAEYTGTECGVEKYNIATKNKGIWVGNDANTPKIGDACVYDWDGNRVGNCQKVGQDLHRNNGAPWWATRESPARTSQPYHQGGEESAVRQAAYPYLGDLGGHDPDAVRVLCHVPDYGLAVIWYMAAAVVAGFFVAFAAIFWFDKFWKILEQITHLDK